MKYKIAPGDVPREHSTMPIRRLGVLTGLAVLLAPMPGETTATARARASLIAFDRATLRERVRRCRNGKR